MAALATDGIAFTAAQLASFLAWSSGGRHRWRVVVQHDPARLGIYRADETAARPRWFVHRTPEGLLQVTPAGGGGQGLAVTAEEVQRMIEARDAAGF